VKYIRSRSATSSGRKSERTVIMPVMFRSSRPSRALMKMRKGKIMNSR